MRAGLSRNEEGNFGPCAFREAIAGFSIREMHHWRKASDGMDMFYTALIG